MRQNQRKEFTEALVAFAWLSVLCVAAVVAMFAIGARS
jgi:hypothetical protein